VTRRCDPLEALRAHVVERHLRAGVRAQDLSGDLPAQARMSVEDWIDSCGLTASIPSPVLDLLERLWVTPRGLAYRSVVSQGQDGTAELSTMLVARQATLAEVAAEHGLAVAEARALVHAAIDAVAEVLVRRATRGDEA
jgi:hypothetical protein